MVEVSVWGLGAMGSGMARLLKSKGYSIVNVWDKDPAKLGKPVWELLGEGEGGPLVSEFDGKFPEPGNLVLIATGSFVEEVYPQILKGIEAKQNVLTIAEEMAFPWASNKDLAEKIDAAAKEQGVRVLGTGINPGFVLDSLVGFLTTPCLSVEKIYARRVNDLSPFGPTVLRTQGVGVTKEQFEKGIADKSIVGHIGFPESIHLIATMLNWTITRIEETREPIVSNTERETPYIKIKPGDVAGCNHRAWGYNGDTCLIELEHPQQICPEVEGVQTGDRIRITGNPNVHMDIAPEIPGGLGTIGVAVNSIPNFLKAPIGLRTMADLVLPSYR